MKGANKRGGDAVLCQITLVTFYYFDNTGYEQNPVTENMATKVIKFIDEKITHNLCYKRGKCFISRRTIKLILDIIIMYRRVPGSNNSV